jgi:hypothetical protein
MSNRILVFDKLAYDPATNQYFQMIFIDNVGSFNMYLKDVPQPVNPGLASAISAVGATPVIAPGGVGNVTGLGTTGALTKWTNGPTSVIGDSVLTEAGGNITLGGGGALIIPALTANGFLFVDGGTAGKIASSAAAINGELLIGSTGTNPVKATLTAGANIVITNGAGSISIAASLPANGVTGAGTTGNLPKYTNGAGAVIGDSIVSEAAAVITITGDLKISGLTANSFLYSGTAKQLTTTAAPTNGQLLIGSTGAAPAVGSIASADATIIITLGAGTIDIGTIGTKVFLISQSATPLNLTAANSQTTYTNEGAGAQIVINLPTAVAGLSFTFIVQDTDGIQVKASAGDTIRLGGSVSSVAGTATSTTIGSVITLTAINATEWIAVSLVGVWVTA